MTLPRRLAVLLFSLLLPWSLTAKGTQEKDFQTAEGKDNFSQSVDLSQLTPGQYNVLVRTRDAAGNISYAGPYNFYYDPTSDNPIITVANPSPGLRLGGSVNVVGVASAPKGAAKVELALDDGGWSVAKGAAFWSFFLDATGLPDGPHQIAVRGTDVNGVVGPVVTVPFVLDQQLPVFSLTSLQSGARVQGVVALQGTLADGNGLKSLDLSTDNRKTSVAIPLAGDAKGLSRSFATTIDTKRFPDGPLVLWFHGVDGQGSEIRRAVLLYVDNTLPQVTVLSPPPTQGLHGRTRFAVRAEKTLGLKSLTARVGEKGDLIDLPVVPGNPFHVVDLDLPLKGSGTVTVIFEATDTGGKVGRTTFVAKLNGDSDLPTVTLAAPLDKARVASPLRLVGTQGGPDAPASLQWSLNGAAPVVQTTGSSFDFEVPGVVSGPNKLVIVPIDTGRSGTAQTFAFTGVLPPPSVQIEAIETAGQDRPFQPGLPVAPDVKQKLKGTISWSNPFKSVTWTLGSGAVLPVALTGKAGVTPFAVAFPEDPPFGVVPVTVTATDVYDQTTTVKTWVDITNLSKPQGAGGLVFADARIGAVGPLVVTPEGPSKGLFTGGKIKSADLLTNKGTVPNTVLAVTHDDRSVTVTGLKDGQFDAVKLRVVTDQGRIYDTELGSVIADTAPPVVALSSPAMGAWVRENLKVEGKATDASGVTRLEWSTDNGQNWQALDPPGPGGTFSRNFNLPGPDNLVNLLLRATDAAGRSGTVLTVVRRDTDAPAIDALLPSLTTGASGLAVVRFKDGGALKSAEVTVNKKTQAVPVDRPFTLPVEAGTTLGFRVLDWAGNVAEQNFTVATDPPAASDAPPGKPEVQLVFPRPDVKGLNGVVPVVGRVVNFQTAPTLTVKGEAGERGLEPDASGWFTFDVDLTGLKSRTLAFSATGAVKETANLSVTLPVDPASELPVARFLAAAERPVLTGNVTAAGWIGDSRGAVGYSWQLDGGAKTLVAVDTGTPSGTFLIDLGVPPVGPHKLTVIPVNARGKEGLPAVTEFVSTVAAGPVQFTNLELGAILSVAKDTRLQGRVPSINSWRKMEIRFADLSQSDAWSGPFAPLDVKKAGDGVWGFDVAVPVSLPYGPIGVIVRGEDALGQKVEGRTLFYRIWPKDPSLVSDPEALVFLDSRLSAAGSFETVPGQPLTGVFRGRPLKGAALNPAQPGVSAAVDGNRVTLDTKDEGLYGPFTVVATTIDNESFSAGPFTVFSDRGGPALTWDVPANADWIRDSVPLKGTAADPSGVAVVEASVDGGTTWVPVPTKAGAFDTRIPVTTPDGLTRVALRAADKGGHLTLLTRAVTKDASAPAWTLVAPPGDRKVNGLTTIIGTATDLNPIQSIEWSDNGKTFKPADGTTMFAFDLDFASYTKLPDQFWLRTTDAAGNQGTTQLIIPLDQDADKPVVQIQSPAEGEVVRSDFLIGGMAFDDDGVKSISWRLDNSVWSRLEGTSSFQIPVTLSSLLDNDHTVEVQAEDIYGTKGNVFRSTFKVSLAPPEATLFSPSLDQTASGEVLLTGAGFDRNGVQSVQVSLDNGLTWNQADLKKKEEALATSTLPQAKAYLPQQRQEWQWHFDSRTLKDGTYLVLVKTTDAYGTDALFTTLVNLDNTAPTLTVSKPDDGEPILDQLDLEGRSGDNIKTVSLRAELRPIESPTVVPGKATPSSAAVLTTELPVTPTFRSAWSLGALTPGWYNLRFEAKDAAGNATYVARNVRIAGASADRIEVLYPQTGETLSGTFVVEGKVTSRVPATQAVVTVDGQTKAVADVDERGYFQIPFDGTKLTEGDHILVVSAQVSSTATLTAEGKRISYRPLGPWVQVQSNRSGSYVTQRPFLSGTAGWTSLPLADGATGDETKAWRAANELHRVDMVEVSLDNGKTFGMAQGNEAWKFRLETLGMSDGPLPLLVRARFHDGSIAVQRLLVQVSQTPPAVELLTNFENGRFNGTLDIAGFSTGDGQVSAVEIAVRQGDKAGYEVPSFIQGMYLDGHVWGATYWEAGLGLTFFQDAVKLQAQVGQAPEGRFWGTVAGAKLIANILQFPAAFLLGPDWSWLSTSFGVGANFSQFSMNGSFLNFSEAQPIQLGGVVIQWETAKALLKDLTFFKSYSWYSEATVWFISSDVQAEAKWAFSTGFRIGLF